MVGRIPELGAKPEQGTEAEMHNPLRAVSPVDQMEPYEEAARRLAISGVVQATIANLHDESGSSQPVPAEGTLPVGKVLIPDQYAEFLTVFQARLTSESDRYAKGIEWAEIQKAIETAGEQALYSLFMMEVCGHKVGVKKEERDGRQGFRFDSYSEESPVGIRNVNYFRAEGIAKDWGVPLMPLEVFKELRKAGIIRNRVTWDHLLTENPRTPENPGLSWSGSIRGTYKHDARNHHRRGGFRCSLWIPAA